MLGIPRRPFVAFWEELQSIITAFSSTATVFNQYRDRDDTFDVPNAAAIRRDNLRAYLERATERASMLVVGEAADPWGCRFPGVPFMGERQLLDPSFPFRGARLSKNLPKEGKGTQPVS